jgi:hypothetical protein
MTRMVEMCWGKVLGGWGLGVGMLVGLVGREFAVLLLFLWGNTALEWMFLLGWGVGVDGF